MYVFTVPCSITPECQGLPEYETAQSAGMDLKAAMPTVANPWKVVNEVEVLVTTYNTHKPLRLFPGERLLVPTGLRLQLPPSLEAQVRPRSGLALRKGLTVLNSPGTIDADYRGVVGVILINHGTLPVAIRPGDRIAQLVVAPIARAELAPKVTLNATERGSGGFGSTDVAR